MKILFCLLSFYSVSLFANPEDDQESVCTSPSAMVHPATGPHEKGYAALLCDEETQKKLMVFVRDGLRLSGWQGTIRYDAPEQEQAASPLTQLRFNTGVLNFAVAEEPWDSFQKFHISLKDPCLDADYVDFLSFSRTKGVMFTPLSISMFGAFIALRVAVDTTQMSDAEQQLCAKVLALSPHVSLIKVTGDLSSSPAIKLSQEQQIDTIGRSIAQKIEHFVQQELGNLKQDLAPLFGVDVGNFQFSLLKQGQSVFKNTRSFAQLEAVQTRVEAFFEKIGTHVERLTYTIPPDMRNKDSMAALDRACWNYALFCKKTFINQADLSKEDKMVKKTLTQAIHSQIAQMSTPEESLITVKKSYIPSSTKWFKILQTLNVMVASSPFKIMCQDLTRTTLAFLPAGPFITS